MSFQAAYSQSTENAQSVENSLTDFFYDADTTQFTPDGSKTVFSGDVVVVAGGIFITADKIELDQQAGYIESTGHVIIVSNQQIFFGEKVKVDLKTQDLWLWEAGMIFNDKTKSDELKAKILGFSEAELRFEADRKKEIDKIQAAKKKIIRKVKRSFLPTSKLNQSDVELYVRLLEREQLTAEQQNPFLGKMTKQRRSRLKERRLHWEKGTQAENSSSSDNKAFVSYFKISGDYLERIHTNDFRSLKSFWTPCHCDDDEIPAWGFRSAELHGQPEGYLDFYHAVLEIKGIPVLYLPYLKIPVKDKRQSGFLPPILADRSDSGTIYSQPVFFDLGENFDTTLTPELFEKRGTKLGVELRYQEKNYSGWLLQVEGMRDRSWMEDIQLRQNIDRNLAHNDNQALLELCSSETKEEELQCQNRIKSALATPTNTWRGSQKWSGLKIIDPRLSVVSQGEVYSDHRYAEDLQIEQNFRSLLDDSTSAKRYSINSHKLHYDGRKLYLGLGSFFGDNLLLNERFEGQQIPADFKIKTQLFRLTPDTATVPFYLWTEARHVQIVDWQAKNADLLGFPNENKALGGGFWESLKINQMTPLKSDGIFKIEQFSNLEWRKYQHSELDSKMSSASSFRGAVRLALPMDTEIPLSPIFGDRGEDQFLRHFMSFDLVFSVRPYVESREPMLTKKFPTQIIKSQTMEVNSRILTLISVLIIKM